ncbi:MAG: DMT family transporter [Longimicrobiales bacterium]|nr:DMT family transporter [Longimicrobiales bacterium]
MNPSSARSRDLPEARRAELGLLLLVGIWSVNFSVLKVGLDAFAPFAFNALRFPLAAAFVTGALLLRGPLPVPDRADLGRVLGLGVLGHVIYQLFFINGMALTRAGNGALMLATAPVFTTLLSRVAGHERVPTRAAAGIVATLAGVALVIGSGDGPLSFSSATVAGDLLVMASAVLWAVYTVGARNVVRKYGALAVMVWTLWIGATLLVLIGLPDLRRMEPTGPPAWAAVVYAGVLGIGLAQVLWYRGVRLIGNTRTAVYQNVVPLGAIAVAWAWLDEVPNLGQLAGAVIVVSGVAAVRTSMRAAT